jgi:hypothetical protein
MKILLMYLIRDGLLEPLPERRAMWVTTGMMEQDFQITPKGREFLARWLAAQPLIPQAE